MPNGESYPLGHVVTEEEFPASLLCVLPTMSWLWGWRSPGLDPASATMALGQHTGFGQGEGRPSRWVRKGERVEKWGKAERQQQRGLEGNEQRGGKTERNTAYFCKQKNAPRQQGGPKAVPGAPTQAAVINPWVTDTESPSRLPGDTCKCAGERARSPRGLLTSADSYSPAQLPWASPDGM